jgi:hypothetical protein
VRRAIALLAAAAAVVAFSFATPALACDGEKKAEAAAVVAKAENGKPVTAEAKGGCGHAAAAAEMAAVDANGKPVVVKASAEGEGKPGCAKAAKGGCGAKKGTAATLAKAEEVKPEEAKTK